MIVLPTPSPFYLQEDMHNSFNNTYFHVNSLKLVSYAFEGNTFLYAVR